jgi:hypothetical protein
MLNIVLVKRSAIHGGRDLDLVCDVVDIVILIFFSAGQSDSQDTNVYFQTFLQRMSTVKL